MLRPCFMALLGLVVGLSAGCGGKDSPTGNTRTTGGDGQAGVKDPTGGGPVKEPIGMPAGGLAVTEDPEVAAYLKNKGWKLIRDIRLSDGKPLVYLIVEDPVKTFDNITITTDDYKMLARSRAVHVLNLKRVKNTDEGLAALAACPQLEAILLGGEDVTDAGIMALAGAKNLDNITLFSTTKVTDEGIKALASLPKIETLHLASLKLDGSGFEPFAGSATLRSVALEHVDGLTDEGVKHLAKLPKLDALTLKSGFAGSKLTVAGIKTIVDARLPAKLEFDKKLIDDELFLSLVAKGWLYGPTPAGQRKRPATAEEVTEIVLDGSKVTDKGFEAALSCTNASHLFLSDTGISDETMKKLGGFKRLTYLSLGGTRVTGAGLEAVADKPIKHLAMEGCKLNEETFKAIGKMTQLEELWLPSTKMDPDWLQHISKLPRLKELNLRSAVFNDDAVKHVVTLPALKELTLNSTELGDKGFQELVKLPTLQQLHVDGTKVTKDVYQKAKQDHPKLRLSFYRYDQ